MAKIVDPDQLNQNTEVFIDTVGKEILLKAAGNLDNTSPGKTSGVTMQALYSFLKEEWRTDAALNKFKFPLKALTKFKFDWQNGWGPSEDSSADLTRDLIRDAGWKEITDIEYACIISLGDIDAPQADQAYYQQVAGFDQTITDFDKTGELNEAIQTYDGTSVDYRDFLKIFIREQGKTYLEGNLIADQGWASIEYDAYRMPLYNDSDPNIATADATIDSDAPFTNMTLDFIVGQLFETWNGSDTYVANDVVLGSDGRWYRAVSSSTAADPVDSSSGPTADWESYPGERLIGTTYYAFNRIIDAGGDDSAGPGTLTQIYEWAQRILRKSTDINSDVNGDGYGTVYGKLAKDLLSFVGSTLVTQPGVFIDSYNINDQNDMEFYDITVDEGGLDSEDIPVVSTKRTFPFVAAGTMVFSSNLVADADAKYWMYFNDAGGNLFDSANAVIVDDNNGDDISGDITQQNITFDFDYTNNEQGGRTKNTDASVWVVAMGLDGAEWVASQFLITQATGLSFPVNAADERNYSNP
jgi:hypothetical protein